MVTIYVVTIFDASPRVRSWDFLIKAEAIREVENKTNGYVGQIITFVRGYDCDKSIAIDIYEDGYWSGKSIA